MTERYDVAIIGAGSAGLSALREVRKHTERFVLINDGPYGTTCARVGCMPSKALIEAANAYHHRHRLREMGVRGGESLSVDLAAVLRRVRALRDGFVSGTLKLTQDLGERSIAGRARFVGPQELDVNGRRLQAGRIVIATGSRPVVPQAWRALGARVLTSDDLFEQATLPPRMAVVGLGGIGAEMAQALARLGIEVSGFDAAERIAGLTDPAVSRAAAERLASEFAVHLGSEAELGAQGEGVRVSAGGRAVVADKVLIALGRRPNVDELGLERIGAELDERGVPRFDPRTMRLGDLPVYIAGDADARLPLLHEAADEGHIAGHNALRETPECFERRTPLAIVFTDPNIAVVGRAYAELPEAETIVGEADFSRQARARMAAENHGRLRVYASRGDGRLLGAELCVPRGEHLAHLLALAIGRGLAVRELLRMPFYHPVLEEGLRGALRGLSGQLGAAGPDLATCEAYRAEALD
jgi:dihydrolipoamide dehydrogenase